MKKILSLLPYGDLDLTIALRVIEQAGHPDPTVRGEQPVRQLQAVVDLLCKLSTLDGLTGLVNASFFHAVLAKEVDRSSRTGRTCGLMVIDVDRFKDINDTYGHPVGDYVLTALAQTLKRSLRSMDTAARIGGDEFAVIFPECTPEDAVHAATRIHRALSPLRIEKGGLVLEVSASAGLVWNNWSSTPVSNRLFALADEQLYQAKRSQRGSLLYPSLIDTQISTDEREALTFAREDKSHGT